MYLVDMQGSMRVWMGNYKLNVSCQKTFPSLIVASELDMRHFVKVWWFLRSNTGPAVY